MKNEIRPAKDIKIFLKKKKIKRRQYEPEHYKNLSEDEQQMLAKYRRNYCVKHKK